MRLLHEKIDELRELLDLPDRNVVSVVTLVGLVETTTLEDAWRSYVESGDVAYVIIGPRNQMPVVRQEHKADGTVTYSFTLGR